MELRNYCHYLYQTLFIPIYLFENHILEVCFPEQESNTYPPVKYLSTLLDSEATVSYTVTDSFSYYGCVKITNSDTCIVVGPVNELAYTEESIRIMLKDFSISRKELFVEFITKIPIITSAAFYNLLIFINYLANETQLDWNDIHGYANPPYNPQIDQQFSDNIFQAKEDGSLYNNLIINKVMKYVESGNVAAVYDFYKHPQSIVPVSFGGSKLRHLKNMFISTISLISYAAINGGLPPMIGSQLSETYIQQVERLTNPDVVAAMIMQATTDFTRRVAETKIPADADMILRQVIHYVRANTHQNLTVAEVAKFAGFSSSHLSYKFKKEIGIKLSNFIRECKLEEAKDLLLYSKKSISEISNDLCFSNQSHFQNVFKKHYGITPQNYRQHTLHPLL